MGIEFESGANRLPERRRKVCYIRIKTAKMYLFRNVLGKYSEKPI